MLPSLARRNPIVVNFHNSHCILVVAFSSCVGIVAFLWLFDWLFINLVMREQSLITGFAARFCFVKLTLGRMPIFTRRSRASTPSNTSCTVVGEWHHGYFLPWILLFFDTLLLRKRAGSEGVAAVCSRFWARSLLLCRNLQRSPCEQWLFSFHW